MTDVLAFLVRVPLIAFIGVFALSDLLSLVAFHSLFNLLGILLFLPLIGGFASLLEKMFPEERRTVSTHLSRESLTVPDAALEAVELESAHLLARVIYQNLKAFDPPLRRPPDGLPIAGVDESMTEVRAGFEEAYEKTKLLEGEILAFTTDLQVEVLDSAQSAAIDRCQSSVREAIHSSKSLKDIQSDLRSFELERSRSLRGYPERFRSSQGEFYEAVFSLKSSAEHRISLEDFVTLTGLINGLHEDLHQEIYGDIRADQVSDRQISPLLNVNREIFNSNHAHADALAMFLLSEAEFESLEAVASQVAATHGADS